MSTKWYSHVSIGMTEAQAVEMQALNQCNICGEKVDEGQPIYLCAQPRLNPKWSGHGTFDIIALCQRHGERLEVAMRKETPK